jgi:hypothetical protein
METVLQNISIMKHYHPKNEYKYYCLGTLQLKRNVLFFNKPVWKPEILCGACTWQDSVGNGRSIGGFVWELVLALQGLNA